MVPQEPWMDMVDWTTCVFYRILWQVREALDGQKRKRKVYLGTKKVEEMIAGEKGTFERRRRRDIGERNIVREKGSNSQWEEGGN